MSPVAESSSSSVHLRSACWGGGESPEEISRPNLDGSWSFAGYFSLLAPNLKTGSTSLGKILPNMGGPRAPYRRLYTGIVMSMALYGAPILSEALTASSKALLHRAQRTIAERGIGGYRTVSFTTATLLAGYRYSRKYLLLHTGTERKPQPARMRALSHWALILRWGESCIVAPLGKWQWKQFSYASIGGSPGDTEHWCSALCKFLLGIDAAMGT